MNIFKQTNSKMQNITDIQKRSNIIGFSAGVIKTIIKSAKINLLCLSVIQVSVFLLAFNMSVFAQQIGTNIGNIAPDIKLPNPDGDSISLHSLRGKLVLIDFWASWCRPCVASTPLKIEAFKNFSDKNFTEGKGFTIFSVSMDRNRDAWTNFVENNNMDWYNVSDLKHWNCAPAIEYGVRQIPANFLINDEGVIIARNLRGEALLNTLERYLIRDPLIDFETILESLIKQLEKLKNSEKYKNNIRQIKSLENKIQEIQKIIEEIMNS